MITNNEYTNNIKEYLKDVNEFNADIIIAKYNSKNEFSSDDIKKVDSIINKLYTLRFTIIGFISDNENIIFMKDRLELISILETIVNDLNKLTDFKNNVMTKKLTDFILSVVDKYTEKELHDIKLSNSIDSIYKKSNKNKNNQMKNLSSICFSNKYNQIEKDVTDLGRFNIYNIDNLEELNLKTLNTNDMFKIKEIIKLYNPYDYQRREGLYFIVKSFSDAISELKKILKYMNSSKFDITLGHFQNTIKSYSALIKIQTKIITKYYKTIINFQKNSDIVNTELYKEFINLNNETRLIIQENDNTYQIVRVLKQYLNIFDSVYFDIYNKFLDEEHDSIDKIYFSEGYYNTKKIELFAKYSDYINNKFIQFKRSLKKLGIVEYKEILNKEKLKTNINVQKMINQFDNIFEIKQKAENKICENNSLTLSKKYEQSMILVDITEDHLIKEKQLNNDIYNSKYLFLCELLEENNFDITIILNKIELNLAKNNTDTIDFVIFKLKKILLLITKIYALNQNTDIDTMLKQYPIRKEIKTEINLLSDNIFISLENNMNISKLLKEKILLNISTYNKLNENMFEDKLKSFNNHINNVTDNKEIISKIKHFLYKNETPAKIVKSKFILFSNNYKLFKGDKFSMIKKVEDKLLENYKNNLIIPEMFLDELIILIKIDEKLSEENNIEYQKIKK